jgi:hypothetical protein
MTNFNYINPLPVSTNNPSVDQPNMTINNASVLGLIAVDHVGFNANSGGTHNQVQLQVVTGTSPPAGILPSTNTLYSQETGSAPLGPLGELFYTRGGSGTGIQLTGPSSPIASGNGYTFLPGGLMFQWGSGAVNTSGTATNFTFPVAFQNNFFSITLACNNTASTSPTANNVFVKSTSLSGFQVINSSSGTVTSIYWMAIGN